MKLLRSITLKALLVLCLVGLVSIGCSGFGKWSPGAQTVADFICNPTADQKAEAAKYLTALDMVQAVAATFFPAAGIAKASAVMTTIAQGGCFLASEVQAALDLLAQAQAKQASVTGLKAAVVPVSVQFPALWKATYKGK